MAEILPMPKLGFDMAEGTLVRKAKLVGEPVAKDEVIADVETDKATIEVASYVGGVVKAWLIEEGTPVPIGTPMVVVGAADEVADLAALGVAPAAPAPAATSAPTAPPAPPVAEAAPSFVAASPVARRMADEAGVDLRGVKGSGPNRRIVKKDVEAAITAQKAAPASPPAVAPASAAKPAPMPTPVVVSADDQNIPLTKMRQIIARRMVESKTTIPHINITMDMDMAAAMDLRKQINTLLPEDRKVSVNDLVLKATALALRQYPNLNASFAGDKIARKGHVNIGVAVALDNGLMTVVVKDADHKSVTQIAPEVKAMAARAREGKVQPNDIDGATFSLSNLGMYGVEEFSAIISPPEAAILAVGAVRETPVVKGGALAPGLRMKITCCADHRVTDGAEVAQFLQAIKKNLEEPLRLML
jgi:pyruvate dehydrogenase E2 component (dihydrolipoamide acetyltransferase)